MEKIQINAELLCEFPSFATWVNKGSSWLGGFSPAEKIICLDRNGNAVAIGKDFQHAKDNNLFPVKAYRLIRSGEEGVVAPPAPTEIEIKVTHIKTFKGDNAILVTGIPEHEALSVYEVGLGLLPVSLLIHRGTDNNFDAPMPIPLGTKGKGVELIGMLDKLTESQAKDIYYLKTVSWSMKPAEEGGFYNTGTDSYTTYQAAMLGYIRVILEIDCDPHTTCILKIKEDEAGNP